MTILSFQKSMETETLKHNKKYKDQQKIEKQTKKNAEMLHKRLVSERLKYDKLKEAQYAKIDFKYDKKLQWRLNKINKQYDRRRIDNKKKILGKEIKPKKISEKKMKDKALAEIQLYAKLSRAFIDEFGNIMIYVMDKCKFIFLVIDGKIDRYINWGHVRWQKNYPHMAFEIDNIWAITSFSNKQQGDQIAQWKDNLPIDIQTKLSCMSIDDSAKNKLRDHMFYQNVIDKYKALNANEKQRLWIK